MAPAVPFALLGVVQMLAVAGWIGLGGAALFPRLRRHVTPAFVIGTVALAAADAATAVQFGSSSSDLIGWLRLGGLCLVALGLAGGVGQSLVLATPGGVGAVVVPLGAAALPSYAGGVAGLVAAAGAWRRGTRRGGDALLGSALAMGLVFTGVAAALAEPARSSSAAALAELAARAAGTAAIAVALVQLSRSTLLGKLAGAILVGVVAMAAGAVGLVGTGVADDVQAQQSQRLLQVAQGEQQTIGQGLGTRAALYAQVLAKCPDAVTDCVQFLQLFSDQAYFAVKVVPGKVTVEVARSAAAPLPDEALVQLAGSPVVQAALQSGASAQTTSGGPVLLSGPTPTLALIEAAPGRPKGVTDARVKPTFAAVYGVVIGDSYLRAVQAQTRYDLSIVADGHVVASSLGAADRRRVEQAARQAKVDAGDVGAQRVVGAEGDGPTVAFVAINEAGNDDVRLATLAVSQPATEALRAQRSVLQRMFLTALVALLVVVGLAIALARRIADPVRRLTVAAGRVRRGDLDGTTSVTSRDEVGALARAFEAMTASLRTATGDLRTAAEQEAALRARLETVVESMSDGLVVTDSGGRITGVNAMAARLLGVEPDAVVGRPLREVVTAIDGDGRALPVGTGERRGVDAELTGADGTTVPVHFSVAPLADRQGRVIVLSDRTREREVERMKTEFLANVSHELRTPLTPIRGYAELLARRKDLARPQVEGFLQEILASTGRMSRAVELLVDVAALEAGRVASEVSKTSVRSLVEDRLRVWKDRYPERAGDLKRRTATRLPAVAVDPRWVNRALDELVDNAVKYTPAGTAITLVAALSEDERGVRVAVRDAGPGFDPDVAAELMGDFSQADASETRRIGGMGLGLGFVNRVAQRFDLELTVDAERGRGAEFALLLPAWPEEPA